MEIPKNITKENLLQAIKKIDIEGVPPSAQSLTYDALYNGKKYPPKLVVSYANFYANGEILDRNSFEGGKGTPCFRLLQQNGFIIQNKIDPEISYFNELSKFLQQSKTGELKTKLFVDNFLGLHVKVSFGQGNQARVPWIAFLKDGQTVQNGIYPVYLFFKDRNILILAYGVSETQKPQIKWEIKNVPTIQQYFLEKNLGIPDRYGLSFVFKTYSTKDELDKKEIDNDLIEIINTYKKIATNKIDETDNNKGEEFNWSEFDLSAQSAGLVLSKQLNLRFISSLLTKPFVILTGLSGSGKTKLAQAFSLWISENESQYCIVPVGADWTNRESLLGFPNALKSGDYIKPDNGALELIVEASKNPYKPYFLILDEMNLSHVERYFADFLSIMETKGKFSLHSGAGDWNGIPAEISLPTNLFIIGTVNIDETTYMFSPKVLDRANVIEFRVSLKEMETYLSNNKPLNLNALKTLGENMAFSFIETASDEATVANADGINKELLAFFSQLKEVGSEFGYRSAAEILRFAAVANKLESSWAEDEIIDAAIIQKLLPKVHGSRRKLEPVLKALGNLCLKEALTIDSFITKPDLFETEILKIKYPLSFEKIVRMLKNLINNGFTSYAEA